MAFDQPAPSLGVGRVHLFAMRRQVARRREGLAAGGAGVGADTGMSARVYRQAAGRRAGLAADGARQVEIATRPAPPPLAQRSRAPSRSFSRRLFLPLLASDHR